MRRLVVLIAFLVIAPSAHADSIVFRRGGDVWRMSPDGTGQRQLTSGATYEWPSAADDGTFVAADSAGQLHRWSAAGAELNVIPVAPFDDTDEEAPTETPTHVRVSPNGALVAYDQAIEGDVATLVTDVGATTATLFEQDGLVTPSWIGNERLLLTRDISFDTEGPALSHYDVGGSVTPWFSDPATAWATGFDAAAGRDGARLAVVVNDAAEHEGTPTRVALRVYAGTSFRCEIELETSDSYPSFSPSLSPDGTRVAWAESDGIHVASSSCTGERVVTLPGAWEPHWSAYSQPVDTSVPKLTLAMRVRPRPTKAFVRKRGIGVRVTVSAPATITVRAGGKLVTRALDHAGTYTVRLRPKVAKRIRVRVSAPGAETVKAVVRPRR